jgi:GNAT superfamily N-acetyltransferase
VSELSLRAATEQDLPVIASLWGELDRFHRELGLAFPEVEKVEEKWLASFTRTLGRFSFIWLAESDGQIAAFLLARLKQSPAFLGGVQVGEISDLYVDQSLRGEGAGAQLVALAMQKFDDLAVHSVEVQILAGNDQGLDFWRKQGFDSDLSQVRKLIKGKG